MKQILQNLKNGETKLEEVPVPQLSIGCLRIATKVSLVSAGTEKMLVDFGKGNLLQKAKSQPDKVRQVIEKIKTDGFMPTLDAVWDKLSTPVPLGYCNVGVIQDIGSNVEGFSLGDRVISNGKHAEIVVVPKNLCARIPANVDDESAAFTVIAAIALQGIRLINPTLGETVVVTGLGLIGLVAVQLLRANGCKVIGLDFDKNKLALAKQFGAEVVALSEGLDPIAFAKHFTRGNGVDAVLITASTKSNEPIHQAATMCRKRGRIVLVGVVGMEMSRADFYEKELSFQVSCSYGPGRYDTNYEDKGQDYPLPYVRWTEQRNFEAVLDLMSSGAIDFKPLISHRFEIFDAVDAYELISSGNPLGVLLSYPRAGIDILHETAISVAPTPFGNDLSPVADVNLGFIGAGNYTSAILLPAFSKTGAKLVSIASASGVSSAHLARKFGFVSATTDSSALLESDEINSVVITTRHNSHAAWIVKALKAGKHVFVEKPLAINREQLQEIKDCIVDLGEKCPILMVGFNRRYSPFVVKIQSLLAANSSPVSMVMTVNAGQIPSDHWTQNREEGGGRVIGEACHFIDLLRHLANSPIVDVQAAAMNDKNKDTLSITLKFENGSLGSIHYLANGSKAFPKERLEVFCNGGILQLDNFRKLQGFGWSGFSKMKTYRQNKGQIDCCAAFVDAINRGDIKGLIGRGELLEVAEACLKVDEIIW